MKFHKILLPELELITVVPFSMLKVRSPDTKFPLRLLCLKFFCKLYPFLSLSCIFTLCFSGRFMQFIDSHAHLTKETVYDQIEEILRRAKQASIKNIINICTDQPTLERGLELSKKHPWI